MEIKVQVGSWYVVEGSAGDTVTNPVTGKPIATVEEGKQTGFLASTPYVITSNDEVGVHKANFKSPLAKLRLLGLFGGGESFALPKGYIAAEFLESTGTQYIKATAIFNNNTKLEMLARQTGSSTNSAFFGTEHMYTADVASKRFCCMVQGSPGQLRFDYGSRTDFSGFYIEQGVCYKITKDAEKNYVDGVLVYSNAPAVFDGLYGALFTRGAGPYNANGGIKGAIYWCNVFNSGKPEHAFVPALTEKGVPCMYDKVTKTPFLNSGSVQFIVGMTCKQALKLAELPSTGGSLTVSLPWEAQLVQHNAEVEAALQAAKSNGWTITVQYRDAEPDNAVYNKYAQCVTVADMLAVNPDYKNDLTPAGEWVYPLPKLQNGQSLWQSNNKVKRVGVSFPELTNAYLMFGSCDLEEWGITEFPKVTNADFILRSYQLKTFKCKFTVLTKFYGSIMNCKELWSSEIESPMLTDGAALHSNCQKLSYFRGTLGKLGKGNNMLNGCILDKDSAMHVLTTIPTWTDGVTHPLTIGIHVDHETDEEVLAAIDDAQARGWTIAVQWNGTATAQTASTWGLRRKPIYAKIGTMVLPDGTTEPMLDWGHYVTNWEANGYQEFASLEEAKEYYNVED